VGFGKGSVAFFYKAGDILKKSVYQHFRS
jgi:hypothetical protein